MRGVCSKQALAVTVGYSHTEGTRVLPVKHLQEPVKHLQELVKHLHDLPTNSHVRASAI